MGQYWTWKNLEKREHLNPHDFRKGLKYTEQWFSGGIEAALQILCTDRSSLGHGGGDVNVDEAPEELKKLIEPMLGRWAGDRVVFSGDYTEIPEHRDDENCPEKPFEHISKAAAVAVYAMMAWDTLQKNPCVCAKDNLIDASKIHARFRWAYIFLAPRVPGALQKWEEDENVMTVLAALDEYQKRKNAEASAPSTKKAKR